jgi:futalosine hydrolase
MKVLVTAATAAEWQPTAAALPTSMQPNNGGTLAVFFRTTGVGMLPTAFHLQQSILQIRPDIVIQLGIAGTFTARLPLSTVVVVAHEFLADTGVWEQQTWKDMFDLQLVAPNETPFQAKALSNPWLQQYNFLNLPTVIGATVAQISTDINHIKQLQKHYCADIESMEGASLHYVCSMLQIPFLQLRAISNLVGVRDKTQWQIAPAIQAVNHTLLQWLAQLAKQS